MMLYTVRVTRKLAVINGLRGIAILVVILRHMIPIAGTPGFGAMSVHGWTFFPLAPVVNSQEAVSLFFILSGFVLALPYASGKRSMASMRDAASFYLRRAKRLLPLLSFVLVWSVLLMHSWRDIELFLHLIWLNVTSMVWFGVDPPRPPSNTPLWSLRVELWFCLLMPLILLALKRMRAEALLLAVIAFSTSIHMLAFAFEMKYRSPIMTSIAGMLQEFVIGMCIARWYAIGMPGKRSGLLLPFSVAMFVAGTMLSQYSQYYGLPAHIGFSHLATVIGMGLGMAALLQSGSLLRRIIECWPLQMAGLMSYSLYAWHAPLLWPFHAQDGTLTDRALFLVFIIGLGFLSYRFIEFPHVRDIRKLLPERRRKEEEPPLPVQTVLAAETVTA
jgi:peptidoglycan/LPS O-acetylase OafA/YrhL